MLYSSPADARATLEDLAIFGAPPAFNELLHVGRPNIGHRERLLARIDDALQRRWLTNDGPLVQEFEQRIAEMTDVEHCVAVSSGTVGLQLAARALGLTGEVIVPSFTFVATVHAIAWMGMEPVFCDIDHRTHNLDPDALDRAITDRTSGIVAVHLWGRPCDVEEVTAVARERGLPLLFDAAQAIGCSHRSRAIGSFGDAEVFSFHATKAVSAGEGGAVTTNDADLARRLRLMRNFGFVDYDAVGELGTNGKMSEVSAAVGLTSLESFEAIRTVNYRNYLRYTDGLRDVEGLDLLPYDDGERHNYQHVVVEVAEDLRDALVAVLHAENVLARRYFYPGCHRLEAYCDSSGAPSVELPATDRVASRVLALPTGSAIREADVEVICSILRTAVQEPDELRRRLA